METRFIAGDRHNAVSVTVIAFTATLRHKSKNFSWWQRPNRSALTRNNHYKHSARENVYRSPEFSVP
jgi:hypothetical protein